MSEPLAHSARAGGDPQPYAEHVSCVVKGAAARAMDMVRHASDGEIAVAVVQAVKNAADFHDLGKLDPDSQAALRRGRDASLSWDHVDAGVAHLSACRAATAAWLVRAHHAPGLPAHMFHFEGGRRLRGRRNDNEDLSRHHAQIARTELYLARMLGQHQAALGPSLLEPGKVHHGLKLRLGLSCLVDADHADTARFDTGWNAPKAPAPRWEERVVALDAYVAALSAKDGKRNDQRAAFYDACRRGEVEAPLIACEGPVGIGKTTAVMAYALRRAIAGKARRIFIVAPFTAILTQTAERLRRALKLPGENPNDVVAEHHHRVDFDKASSRDLAVLWSAPIILTTAVQLFETLSSNNPASLRKLHALPGSVVILDEAHAALPVALWGQNWRWITELADDWGCSFVFSSGSLSRFWESEEIVGDKASRVPELTPPGLMAMFRESEARRIEYRSLGRIESASMLVDRIRVSPGPRLVIMSTVKNAALLANMLSEAGEDVRHLSTALSPSDRAVIMAAVGGRLRNPKDLNWTLVATSLVEAGVDMSFRTAFRERFSLASLIQVGGRVNRGGDEPDTCTVWDFVLAGTDGFGSHPTAIHACEIVGDFFKKGRLSGEIDAADLVTKALTSELRRGSRTVGIELVKAEQSRDYPKVAELGRVIDADTKLVVVDQALRDRLVAREQIEFRELLNGSVQIWTRRLVELRLEPIAHRDDIFWWPYEYEPNFLGIMAGVLKIDANLRGEPLVL